MSSPRPVSPVPSFHSCNSSRSSTPYEDDLEEVTLQGRLISQSLLPGAARIAGVAANVMFHPQPLQPLPGIRGVAGQVNFPPQPRQPVPQGPPPQGGVPGGAAPAPGAAAAAPPPALAVGPHVALVPANLAKTVLKVRDAAGEVINVELKDAAKRQALDVAFAKAKQQFLTQHPHAQKVTIDIIQRTIRYQEGTPPQKHVLDLEECCVIDAALKPLIEELEKAADALWNNPKDPSNEYRNLIVREKQEGPQPIHAKRKAERELHGNGINPKTGAWDQATIISCMEKVYEAYKEQLGPPPVDALLKGALERMAGGITAAAVLRDQLRARLQALQPPDSKDATKYPQGDKDPQYVQDLEVYNKERGALEDTANRLLHVDWVALLANLAFAEPLTVGLSQEAKIKEGLDRALKVKEFIQNLVEKEREIRRQNYPKKHWFRTRLPKFMFKSLKGKESNQEPAGTPSKYAQEIASVSLAALDPLERRHAHFQLDKQQGSLHTRLSSVEEGLVRLVMEERGATPDAKPTDPLNLPVVFQNLLSKLPPAAIGVNPVSLPAGAIPQIDAGAMRDEIQDKMDSTKNTAIPATPSTANMTQVFKDLCQAL